LASHRRSQTENQLENIKDHFIDATDEPADRPASSYYDVSVGKLLSHKEACILTWYPTGLFAFGEESCGYGLLCGDV
jgi:hypothetical protein